MEFKAGRLVDLKPQSVNRPLASIRRKGIGKYNGYADEQFRRTSPELEATVAGFVNEN
jgi:hypothetical protein